jgi:hypothetical protein
LKQAIAVSISAVLILGCPDSIPTPTTDAGDAAAADIQSQDGPPALPAIAIAIDGLFEDWQAVPDAVEDPVGDATGGFDLKQVKATSRGRTRPLPLATAPPARRRRLHLAIVQGQGLRAGHA